MVNNFRIRLVDESGNIAENEWFSKVKIFRMFDVITGKQLLSDGCSVLGCIRSYVQVLYDGGGLWNHVNGEAYEITKVIAKGKTYEISELICA